jgi:hypothetical protein
VTGVFTLELTVNNKKGDISRLSLPLIIEERNLSAPKIELKEYLVYVKEGQTVDFRDYIVKATSKNEEDLTSFVRIDDNVNFNTSGTYIVNYFVTDKNGAQGHSVLYIVVE